MNHFRKSFKSYKSRMPFNFTEFFLALEIDQLCLRVNLYESYNCLAALSQNFSTLKEGWLEEIPWKFPISQFKTNTFCNLCKYISQLDTNTFCNSRQIYLDKYILQFETNTVWSGLVWSDLSFPCTECKTDGDR